MPGCERRVSGAVSPDLILPAYSNTAAWGEPRATSTFGLGLGLGFAFDVCQGAVEGETEGWVASGYRPAATGHDHCPCGHCHHHSTLGLTLLINPALSLTKLSSRAAATFAAFAAVIPWFAPTQQQQVPASTSVDVCDCGAV